MCQIQVMRFCFVKFFFIVLFQVNYRWGKGLKTPELKLKVWGKQRKVCAYGNLVQAKHN